MKNVRVNGYYSKKEINNKSIDIFVKQLVLGLTAFFLQKFQIGVMK